MILPESSVFLDYQLLFNTKSNMRYKAHNPDNTIMKQKDAYEVELRTMNLDSEKFEQLLDLYDDTK